MKNNIRMLALMLLSIIGMSLIGPSAFASERHFEIIDVKIKQGDNILWSAVDFDDSHWQTHRFTDSASKMKNYWYRFHIHVFDDLASDQATELFFHEIGSYEIYWDDVLIDKNGTVAGNIHSEIPGTIDRLLVVPKSLYTKGEHIIAIRVSSHHQTLARAGMRYDFELGAYGETFTQHGGMALIPLVTLGGTLVIAIYFILMFILDRSQISYLLFGLTCVGTAGMVMAETWRGLFGYPYDYHILRLQVILSCASVVAICLPGFVIFHFNLIKLRTTFYAYSICLLLLVNWLVSYDLRAGLAILSGLLVSVCFSLIAWRKKLAGAKLMMTGFSICLLSGLMFPGRFVDEIFFYFFPLMTIFILAALAFQHKLNKAQRDTALIKSERLKTELLKKNIQPHFLLNSLTSLASWISIDVKVANKMILSLAQEFRLVVSMSESTLVKMKQELELCHSHIQIMEFRKAQKYILLESECPPSLLIPPGVIHTLIENAISHNRYKEKRIEFKLTVDIRQTTVYLTLLVPLADTNRISIHDSTTEQSQVSIKELSKDSGTGTQYIKARLEEAWPRNWSFESNQVNNYWQTTLEFPEEYHIE